MNKAIESEKKYNVIPNLTEDAPSGDINWCTISFLTPQKNPKTKYLDAKGFKVHNGYTSVQMAGEDSRVLKDKCDRHDIFISQMGKIYAWDDSTRTETVEFDNEKLNELEQTRRESVDKIKLMQEQMRNEGKAITAKRGNQVEKGRAETILKKLQTKLHAKGKISKQELELMQDTGAPLREIKDEAASRERVKEEMAEITEDYLDENPQVALKFGCISIFSPKQIGGLKTLCFKVRGLFETPAQLERRVRRLERLYPNDRIYRFEVGKWCAFSETDGIEPQLLLSQLNYAMKCHGEEVSTEKDTFEKRKEDMMTKNQQATEASTAPDNRRARRQEQRRKRRAAKTAKAKGTASAPTPAPPAAPTQPSAEAAPTPSITSLNDDEGENEQIQSILNYLDEPELRNKYPATHTTTEVVEL
ncbi:Hypothetical protein MVR_LOCUS83 [uncultured virus]|nr:Hypothetical protein MVR_LOCUS83 [uncultured virus]